MAYDYSNTDLTRANMRFIEIIKGRLERTNIKPEKFFQEFGVEYRDGIMLFQGEGLFITRIGTDSLDKFFHTHSAYFKGVWEEILRTFTHIPGEPKITYPERAAQQERKVNHNENIESGRFQIYNEALRNFYREDIYPYVDRLHEQLFLVKNGWNPKELIGPQTFILGKTTYTTVVGEDGTVTIETSMKPYKVWKGGVTGVISHTNGQFMVTDIYSESVTYYKDLLSKPEVLGVILLNNY